MFALVLDEDKERMFIITGPGCWILRDRGEEHIICFLNNAMQMYGRNVGANYWGIWLKQQAERLQTAKSLKKNIELIIVVQVPMSQKA